MLGMDLRKHRRNTDVAFEVVEVMNFSSGCELWRGNWWNVADPEHLFKMWLPEDKIHITKEQLNNWEEYK